MWNPLSQLWKVQHTKSPSKTVHSAIPQLDVNFGVTAWMLLWDIRRVSPPKKKFTPPLLLLQWLFLCAHTLSIRQPPTTLPLCLLPAHQHDETNILKRMVYSKADFTHSWAPMHPGKWMTHRTGCHCRMQFPSKTYIWNLHCSCPVAAASAAVTARLLFWPCMHPLNSLSPDKGNSGATTRNDQALHGKF